MNKLPVLLIPIVCAVCLLAADQPKIPPMPDAVSGNAVASLKNGLEVYSFMGVGTKKTWDDITNKVYTLRLTSGKWTEGRPVPGVAGRVAASAATARDRFSYSADTRRRAGNEMTVADVNSYVPDDHRWYRAEDIPVPVDSAVIGVNHDRYIYLVGGRSKNGPVNNVQVYDVEKNVWSQATALPGTPVYGHAGALADDTIVYVEARKRTHPIASLRCLGRVLDGQDRPQGSQQDRVEQAACAPGAGPFRNHCRRGERDHRILFSGGTAAPHNFKGLGADGKLAEISPVTFAFEVHGSRWEAITDDTYDVRTDGRGILTTPLGPMILGGMLKNGAISARVLALPKK